MLALGSYSGAWLSGLDPSVDTTDGANLSQMNAIFGGRFELVANDDGGNARVAPDLASSHDQSV